MGFTAEDLEAKGYVLSENGWVKVPKRKNKMNAVKTVVDGIKYDSGREAKRGGQLKLQEKAGLISDLRLQVRFSLATNESIAWAEERNLGKLGIPKYTADFIYIKDGVEIVEDSKGHKTEAYKLKKRLMKLIHNIDILET